MKIYVIQEIVEGIGSCPILFIEEEKADKHYIDLVNEVNNTNFINEAEASDYLRKLDTFHDILYWTTNIQ